MNSSDIIAWSAAAAAVAFTVLCLYLIGVLKSARRSLDSAKTAVEEVKETIDGLQGEIKRLTHTVNGITADVQGKLQAADPLFDAVRDVGVMLRDVTGSARGAAHSFSRAMRRKASEIDSGAAKLGWMRWAALGVRVAAGLKDGWNRKQSREKQMRHNAFSEEGTYPEENRDFGTIGRERQQTNRDLYDRLNH